MFQVLKTYLYKAVAQYKFHHTKINAHIWQNISADNLDLSTLFKEKKSKSNFSHKEWQNICFFEHHFAQHWGVSCLVYDEQLKGWWDFHHLLSKTSGICSTVTKCSTFVISTGSKRQDIAAEEVQVCLQFEEQFHKPYVIESELKQEMKFCDTPYSGYIYCLGYTHQCSLHPPGCAHVYLDVPVHFHSVNSPDHIAIIISNSIFRKHNIVCASVLSFDEESFSSNGHVHLWNSVLLGDIKPVYGRTSPNFDVHPIEGDKCARCYNEKYAVKPLHWRTFSLSEEWHTGMPLQIR